jgi:hypothetical protein
MEHSYFQAPALLQDIPYIFPQRKYYVGISLISVRIKIPQINLFLSFRKYKRFSHVHMTEMCRLF